MKLVSLVGVGMAGLLSAVAAQQHEASCPTATRTMQNRGCNKECAFSDCNFTSTVRNPCGCPSAIPTATLVQPCEADCPYQGCGMVFHTSQLACPTPTQITSRRRPTPRPSSSSSAAEPTRIVTSIVTLPPVTRTTPCPVITKTTSPADCPAMRCPVPTCQVRSTIAIPCDCNPKTLLHVQGCATACPDGCLTRTETISADRC